MGPYGTFNPLIVPNESPSAKLSTQFPRLISPNTGALTKDPVVKQRFLPAPWLTATTKAKHASSIGLYGHYMDTKPTGVYVMGIVEGSTAHKAGLLPGDVVTHFGNKRLKSFADPSPYDPLKPATPLTVWNAHTNRTSKLTLQGLQK